MSQTQTTKTIKAQLNDDFYNQTAQRLGVSPAEAKALIDQSLPTLVEGLARNTQKKEGAENLVKALAKHDGSLLETNEDFFEAKNLDEGDKILKHILGDTRDDIAAALAVETKTEPSQAKKTLAALSPMVMGALGKAVKSEKLNADQVTKILKLAVQKRDFGAVAQSIAVLIWDKNNNGQFKDDLFEVGRRFLSRILNRSSKK